MKDLTGESNIRLGCLALGLSPKQVEERFDSVVDFVDIGNSIRLPMRALSSGQAARLRFGISTAAQPDILLIDEALATGDAKFRKKSRERINQIRDTAGTVVLVSHSMSTIRQTCTRGLLDAPGSTSHGRPDRRGRRSLRVFPRLRLTRGLRYAAASAQGQDREFTRFPQVVLRVVLGHELLRIPRHRHDHRPSAPG